MYVEADLLYAYLKPTDWLKGYSSKILKKFKVITSVITIVEIELVSRRDFDDKFANSVLERLEKIKNLKIIQLKAGILRKAVDYRKEFDLNVFDAIHAATAFTLKEDIVSTDKKFDLVVGVKRSDPRVIISGG